MSKLLTWRGHAWICLLFRLYLGGVFLVACSHKILMPASFAVDVATYQLLPLPAVNMFALVLPWVELLTGLMLVTGVRVRAAALLVAAMMLAFLIAVGWALHLDLDMSCGCFASQAAAEDDPISWRTVVRDSGWLLQALYVLVVDRQPIGLETFLSKWRSRHA